VPLISLKKSCNKNLQDNDNSNNQSKGGNNVYLDKSKQKYIAHYINMFTVIAIDNSEKFKHHE
jgi:hypothetical protein